MKRRVLTILLLAALLVTLLPQAALADSFTDVDPEAYYAAPVAWAVENGVTQGTGNNKFSPEATCTRAQVVTFLWRATGSPEPEGSGIRDQGSGDVADVSSVQNPFSDVKEKDYFYKAVLWAVENEITTGTGGGKFSPNASCTRGQVVTFLWRTEDKPEPTVGDGALDVPFADVKATDYFYKAVLWAVENEITTGTGNGKFSPNATCTRGQIVTFLYRDLVEMTPEEPDPTKPPEPDPTEPPEPYPTEPPEPETKTLPVFHITTENGAPIVSKEEYVRGELTITNADDALCLHQAPLGIRGRGNYSWASTEKKSYRIKFDSKVNLLGQGKGKAKSWTLLAVHCDKSLLRTEAAFYFASRLGNLPFVSSSSFVQLYLNDEYLGVYEVCDQIQVDSARVDVDDSGTQPDIGYLVELDQNASEDVIRISNGNTFEVKSDYVNQEQLDFIADYLSQCIEAIESGDQAAVEALIDLPSAVDAYLVEEYMKNLDVGWGSFYFTKPAGDKLYFGPVWDFDLCAGNAENDNWDPAFKFYKYTYVGNPYFDDMQQSDWFLGLRACGWFNDMVAARWEAVKGYAAETVAHIGEIAATYQSDFEKNFERWPVFGTKINREPAEILHIRTFPGQVNYLKNWLTNRADWLTRFYAGKVSDIS